MKLLGRGAWALFGLWLLSLFGCATSTPLPAGVRDGEAQAVAIAWRLYGRTDTPPLVRWRQGDQLDCIDPHSGARGFSVPWVENGDVACRGGLTMSMLECWVAWTGELSFSETALAHELLHVAHARRGIFDPRHRRPEWEPGGLVDQANEAIREAGR